jgi:hypothetical protein
MNMQVGKKYRFTLDENVIVGEVKETDRTDWARVSIKGAIEAIWLRFVDWQLEEVNPPLSEQIKALPVGTRFKTTATGAGYWLKVYPDRFIYVYKDGESVSRLEKLESFTAVVADQFTILGEDE